MGASLSSAMKAMRELCLIGKQGPKSLLEVLPVFYHHLHRDLSPRVMLFAFASLTAMTQSGLHEQIMNQSIASSLADQWPSIERWTLFIIRQCVDNPDHAHDGTGFMSRGHSLLVTTTLFSFLASHSMLCGVMGSSPAFVSTLCRLYLRTAKTNDTSLLFVSDALHLVMAHPDLRPDLSSLHESMSLLHMQPSEMARTCLALVNKQVCSGSEMQSRDLRVLLGSLHMVSSATIDSTAMSRAFIAQQSVTVITSVFTGLTSYKSAFNVQRREHWEIAGECLKICGRYLLKSFEDGGFACVVEAVRGRLLTSIIKAFPNVALEGVSTSTTRILSVKKILLDLLKAVETYSIYHSVLRAIHRSLVRISKHDTERHLQGSPLLSAWATLKQTVDERLQVKYFWDDGGFITCNNSKVSSHETFQL